MIPIKSEEDIRMLRKAGEILSKIMQKLKTEIKPGMRTKDIDRMAEELISAQSALPAFKNYQGFPSNICISVNEEVIHGIPGERVIEEGDIVSLYVGVIFKVTILTLP